MLRFIQRVNYATAFIRSNSRNPSLYYARMSNYVAQVSGSQIDATYQKFFEEFYKISDSPEAHEKYADQFTGDGTLIIASKKAVGRSEIIAMRHAMWEKVASRKHTPIKLFVFGNGADELMLYGTVEYGLKDGRQSSLEWGARAQMLVDGSNIKMKYYQVYLDTAAMNPPS